MKRIADSLAVQKKLFITQRRKAIILNSNLKKERNQAGLRNR